VLGVPAEIVIELAEPADACPEPLPPVVQAAIATPMIETPRTSALAATTRFLLFFNLKIHIFKALLRMPASQAVGKLAV
jgi:hypothetical protein